ncbi:polygalacturonase 1 beta-like protein 2 [Tasmannia lanceolata]|uniref:polygalacturonase 1 beta-like protein 2 n=1 Tax=Tasmannia lanceolata TaxID=3420 RepID=UPI0040632AF2
MGTQITTTLLLLFILTSPSFSVSISVNGSNNAAVISNPFTPKASLIRYWNRQILNEYPKPSFLLSKASPLTAVKSSIFQKLAEQNSLSSHLQAFCSSANLFCFTDLSPSLEKHTGDSNFAVYTERNFTNYGTSRLGGSDSFKNYSDDVNVAADSFRRYSRASVGHSDMFSNYVADGNVVDSIFNSYAAGTTGGSGEFTNYARSVNAPDLKFSSYDSDSNGRAQSFSSYSDEANAGDQSFVSYGKRGNGVPVGFTSYGKDTNVIGSGFSAYSEGGNGANDSFISYGFAGNVPENTFRSYGEGGNAGSESFTGYRDSANVGDDSFTSYAKNSNSGKANFVNYGNSANIGTDTFNTYGQGSSSQDIGFKIYGHNTTFKDYAKKGITFAKYRNSSNSKTSGISVNKWVEPGKFFRESMLKEGKQMPMPDIKDRMPERSFLPRSIVEKMQFSTARISDLMKIFHASENSTMGKLMGNTLTECERAASEGETKRCVVSVEDMIDFVTSVLGRNVVVESTESVEGSKRTVEIGRVVGLNGGMLTESVSCHQSLFPYMVYYCHSVPKVRVYEAEILDKETKERINGGVAICHLDTSAWSEGHGAFVALGGKPGKIEVCHWIFENDMTWVVAD